jgi:hypothetical protein
MTVVKHVMIHAIDHDILRRSLPESFGCTESAKSSTDTHDSWTGLIHNFCRAFAEYRLKSCFFSCKVLSGRALWMSAGVGRRLAEAYLQWRSIALYPQIRSLSWCPYILRFARVEAKSHLSQISRRLSILSCRAFRRRRE